MHDLSSIVYVIFEEYIDRTRTQSRAYIKGDEDLFQDNCAGIHRVIRRYFDIIDFFSYEKTKYVYDKENVAGLLFPLLTLDSEYPGVAVNLFSQLTAHGFVEESDLDEILQPQPRRISFFHHDVTNDLLGKMVMRQLAGENLALLSCQSIITNVGQIEFHIEPQGAKCQVTVCTSISELHSWFSDHRKHKRKYIFNPKHGDSTHPSQYYRDASGSYRKAAQLECTGDEAQDLLDKAIGDECYSTLWFWDDTVKKYIYFKYQGKNQYNEYHCYHLMQGEPDFDDIDREKVKVIKTMATP